MYISIYGYPFGYPYGYPYMDIHRDIRVQHLDIYMWIPPSRCGYLHGYPHGYPCATFRYLLWDLGYLHAINHSGAASHRSIARKRQNQPSMSRCLLSTTTYRLFLQEAQKWAPAPRLRRCPACAGPRCPAGAGPLGRRQRLPSGLAPTRLLSCGDGRPGADTTSSWSHDGGRTGKKINVSGVPARVQKAYFRSTGRGNWATGVHQAFSDGF